MSPFPFGLNLFFFFFFILHPYLLFSPSNQPFMSSVQMNMIFFVEINKVVEFSSNYIVQAQHVSFLTQTWNVIYNNSRTSSTLIDLYEIPHMFYIWIIHTHRLRTPAGYNTHTRTQRCVRTHTRTHTHTHTHTRTHTYIYIHIYIYIYIIAWSSYIREKKII